MLGFILFHGIFMVFFKRGFSRFFHEIFMVVFHENSPLKSPEKNYEKREFTMKNFTGFSWVLIS